MVNIFIRSFIAISITTLILCGLFIYLIASSINGITVYKETDRYNYYSLTYKQIQNAPRISQSYYFESQPGDGYPPSNAIIFKDTTNAEPLRVYFADLGYIKEKRTQRGMEMWCQPKKACKDRFYLYVDKHAKEVRLTSIQE
ncbi:MULTISPECIES: hypothetical protein [unclassified Leclercia]|uniref:hypothetical protein n=1 Tax=unclassified Leclercia TaxID=2627398 RepID=UPI000DF2D6F1|nr:MULTISPECIES: hypothetical protein [unclassified Leclercia]AXF66430.1 hypothetical protein DVA44_21205 [Leclercia sp. W17]